MTIRHLTRPHGLIRLSLIVAAVLCVGARGVRSESLDQDFEFASGLVEMGFPDFAEKVVQQVLRTNPDQKDRARLIQAEILISKRQFGDAEKLVAEMGAGNPKAQAISLALAKGYYASGDTEKAKQLYNDFFKQYEGRVPTDADLLRFYQDSAFQFGQMLEMAGDLEGSAKAYGRVLATKPDRNTERRLQAKQAELYVQAAKNAPLEKQSKFLADAKKLCEDIQWGGLDIWFGQSVITLAHIELIKNNPQGAEKILMGNMDIFKDIDKYLKDEGLPLSVSPMAGARFLLGDLYQSAAEDLVKKKASPDAQIKAYGSALIEFYNVFAKYGDSEWGQQAGVRAGMVKGILEDRYGKKVNINLGDNTAKAVESYFRLADNLHRQKKHAAAIDEYINVLNQFPETSATPAALANLTEAYAELNDTLMVKALIGYTGDRFSKQSDASLALLRIGKYYFDKKDEPMYMLAYETYLTKFPKNERAAAVLFTLAGIKKKAGDEKAATAYFERIVDNYPKDRFYPKALSQLAWGYYATTNLARAVEGFQVYIKESQPSPARAQAQFALADSYRQLGKLSEALVEYETLVQWLAPKNNPYGTSTADVKKNGELLSKSVFQRGYCYARLKEPKESIPDYRDKAIRAYDQFAKLFPDAALAPAALSAKGTVQLEVGQYDEAMKTFDDLARKYPNSDEGKSALFALTRSAMEIKLYDQARQAFQKMMENSKIYSADEFARIGQMMLDAGLYPEAMQAFDQVSRLSTERTLLERSLFGLGRAQFEQKDYPKAIQAMEELMEKYPKSGLFYDAKFTLGRAYRETGRLSDAEKVLSDVFKYADTPILINQASYDLGTIQKEQDNKQGALASFYRIALLADPTNPVLRPLIEKSLIESIELGMELQRYQDVQDSCDQYLKLFPESDKISLVRQYKADARLKASVEAAAAPVQPAGPAKP